MSTRTMSVNSSNPVVESKTAKKRKAKAPSATTPPVDTSVDAKVNGTDHDDGSHALLRDVQK